MGQWFQSESGLHQNWMREYDPTTGRYLQADPLGLVDGPSVYGYALQNPGRYSDPTGEIIPQAIACLANPWCRAAAGAAAGVLYGYLTDEDECYSWQEALLDAGLGAASAYGGGKVLGQGFRPGGYLNRGPNLRIGIGPKGGRWSFRAGGKSVRQFNKIRGKTGDKIDFFDLGPK